MQVDKQIIAGDRFAIAADNAQWILQRRAGRKWTAIGFVRSTKAVLARCMREADAAPSEIKTLLADLPDYFPGWEACHDAEMSSPMPRQCRVLMPDGRVSDILNLTRAKDIARAAGGTVVAADFRQLQAAE